MKLHFCTYHKRNHPIDDFGLTKYNVPRAWCKEAYREDSKNRYAKRNLEADRAKRTLVCGNCGQEKSLTEFDKFNGHTCQVCMSECSVEGCHQPRIQRYDREGLDRFCALHRREWKREVNHSHYQKIKINKVI